MNYGFVVSFSNEFVLKRPRHLQKVYGKITITSQFQQILKKFKALKKFSDEIKTVSISN